MIDVSNQTLGKQLYVQVTIPSAVTLIESSAFKNCSKLTAVTIKSMKVKTIGKNAFSNIAKNATIKVPKSKKAAYTKLLKKAGYKQNIK